MNKKIPNKTKVVVIGGGVIGCSVAYHLAKFGWKETIVLEIELFKGDSYNKLVTTLQGQLALDHISLLAGESDINA